LLLAFSDKLFLLEIAGSSPLLCLVVAAAPRPSEHQREARKHMEWYELKGHRTDAALPPLQAASEGAGVTAQHERGYNKAGAGGVPKAHLRG
jgi:hypothetical protein